MSDTIPGGWFTLPYPLQKSAVERFKLSKDPHFEEKVRDIVGLYLIPPDRALVLCAARRARFRPWTAPRRSSHYGLACRNPEAYPQFSARVRGMAG